MGFKENGVYTVNPINKTSFEVFCDMKTDGEDGQSFTSALMALLDSTGGGRSTKTALVTSEVSFGLETRRFIN